MDHFLITRFNLKKEDWKKDKNSQDVLNPRWIENRIELFKKFCLPSVLGQTTKNFTWLIFFEKGSGRAIEELIKELQNYSFIEAIQVEGYKEFQLGLPGFIEKRVSENSQYVLTTRLDNDDAINKEFISKLQEKAKKPAHNKVLHFPNGLFLDLGKRNRLASHHYPLNQFVSLLERKNNELKTVFCREHDKWDSEFKIDSLNLQDAWLQVTHDKNMANRFKGKLVFSRRLKGIQIRRVAFDYDYNLKVLYYSLRKRG